MWALQPYYLGLWTLTESLRDQTSAESRFFCGCDTARAGRLRGAINSTTTKTANLALMPTSQSSCAEYGKHAIYTIESCYAELISSYSCLNHSPGYTQPLQAVDLIFPNTVSAALQCSSHNSDWHLQPTLHAPTLIASAALSHLKLIVAASKNRGPQCIPENGP